MQVEIEAKFLDINPDTLRGTLKKHNARLVQSEQLMKRNTFDYPDKRLYQVGGWVRVRDEGNKVTLAYKQLDSRNLDGTKEVSVDVSDFDATCNLLTRIGLVCKSYQETKRETWMLGNVEVAIDTWPWIPSFVELEAQDEPQLKAAAASLGLNWDKALHGSVETAYQAYYDVTEKEIDAWERITFEPVPDWLASRKISA